MTIGSRICDSCKNKLSKEPPYLNPEPDSPGSETEEPGLYVHSPEAVASHNKCLADIGETPYSLTKARGKKYSQQKVERITEAMKHTIISGETIDDGSEKLKEKFRSTVQRSEQLQILTVLPKSWSLKNSAGISSENYSFILQDAAQGFHWNNSQATLHPFIAYFVDSGEVCYVIISDCLHHDTIAVSLFQKC